MSQSRYCARDFTIGWVCALSVERAAAEQVLDERYDPQDWCHDSFALGRIGGRNVVIGCLPAGFVGTNPAAVVATRMEAAFPCLQIRLTVGIGGGVPSAEADVRLGDVVISQPINGYGGVVQYDFGKAGANDQFHRTGFLNAPPRILLDAVTDLRSRILRGTSQVWEHLEAFHALPKFIRVQAGHDVLFQPEAIHIRGSTCEHCDREMAVLRTQRDENTPVIHYGIIASGNQVVKDAVTRDRWSDELGGVLCFEMEAAGLMNDFPCLVIRGICDYADSHKNKSWQPYAAATAAACAKEIILLLPAPNNEIHRLYTVSSHKSTFMVPFGRDNAFVGREATLADIGENILFDENYHRRIALVGLGGIGKSQVAIEYAYRVRDREPQLSIFWVHASNAARFEQAYREIAERIALPGHDDPQVNILQQVHRWLSDQANGPWLIILDNVDDNGTFFSVQNERQSIHDNNQAGQDQPLETFLPQVSHGQIIITSRDQIAAKNLVSTFGRVLTLEVMSIEESIHLLRVKRVQIDGFEQDAQALIKALDQIPIAITQAASYIDMSGHVSILKYLQLFRESEQNRTFLLENCDIYDLRRDASHRTSVMTTWQITFNQIRKDNPKATDLLALMSMFDRQSIPEYLIRGDMDPLEFNHTIRPLVGFSLIHPHADDSFTMHGLIQTSTKMWLKTYGETDKWASAALESMDDAFPSVEYETWPTCRALLPHAREILRQIPVSDNDVLNHVGIGNVTGHYLSEIGEYQLSELVLRSSVELGPRLRSAKQLKTPPSSSDFVRIEKMKTKSLRPTMAKWRNRFLGGKLASILSKTHDEQQQQTERLLGATKLQTKIVDEVHPLTLISMYNLASTYLNQGRWKEAEDLQTKELALCKTQLGAEHPSTLLSMGNLARTYSDQGRWKAAEELSVQVLETRKRVLGAEHPHTLTSMNNLASTYSDQGRWKAAEELSVQVLETRKRVLGADHPSTLLSMGNLARTYSDQGRWEAAEELEVQVLETRKRVLGAEHPSTLLSMGNLASTYSDQGRWEAAEELSVQVLETGKRVLGAEHPSTLLSMNNLASTYSDQGRWEAAEELEVQVLETRKRVLGAEHPSTLLSMGNLASTYSDQGRWEAAEKLSVQVLETGKRVLGADHPHTLTSMNNLASTYRNQGRWEAAEELEVQVLETSKRVLGAEHPSTLTSMGNLASTYSDQGRWEAAEELKVQVLKTRKRVLGAEHPSTLLSMGNLARTYSDQGRWEAAEELEMQVLETSKRVLGADHPDTLTSMNNLAYTWRSKGQHTEALQLMKDCMRLRGQVLGPDHPDTVSASAALDSWQTGSENGSWETGQRKEVLQIMM